MEIAQKHINVIKVFHPDITVTFTSGDSPYNKGKYNITITDPIKRLYFRDIEIYASSIGNIFKHHVAPVRGFYNGNFYVTASALYALTTGICMGTYMIKSKKYYVQDVLLKYRSRGFRFTKELSLVLKQYMLNNNIVISVCPTFYGLRNYYNILEAHRERPESFHIPGKWGFR